MLTIQLHMCGEIRMCTSVSSLRYVSFYTDDDCVVYNV